MLTQFTYNANHGMTLLEANFTVGASGAVSLLKGAGVASITKVATGVYKVQLMKAHTRHLGTSLNFYSAPGSSVAVTALATGSVYQILTVGTTTQAQWVAAGVPASVTAAPGVTFVALGTTTGTGTAAVPASSGLSEAEIIGDPNTTCNTSTAPYLMFQTLAAGTPTSPTQGTVITLQMWWRSASVKGPGE